MKRRSRYGSRHGVVFGGAIAAFALASIASPSTAFAGGMEIPDHGSEALGRGGAFVAKADNPTALHYNIGGLAQQRGTRLLINANVARSSLAFQREGVYPGDPNDPATPWAGKRFARAENEGGLAVLPFLGATTDFGLERATFAIGTFAPSVVGARVYPLVMRDGAPSPVRYDNVGGTSSVVLFHTAAAAFRIGDVVDLGVALHVVQANVATRMISYTAMGSCTEVKTENAGCDARGEASTTGWTATGSIGALIHPGDGVNIGLNFRGPVYLNTDGDAKLTSPSSLQVTLPDTRVAIAARLPWVARAGIRKAVMRSGNSSTQELGDLELDVTYEAWGSAMRPGPKVNIENVLGKQERKQVQANYNDTFSVRAGGSINTTKFSAQPITFRAGAYYDSSATESRFTRVDNDTLTKVAATVGLGFSVNSVFKLDFAYASVFDISRVVADGTLRPTSSPDAPVVNNGVYGGHTHIASLGATIELDKIFSKPPTPSEPTRGKTRRKNPRGATVASASDY